MDTEITSIDNLLDYLFADKKAVYIEDITINSTGSYDISWCLDFTRQLGDPEWHDTRVSRKKLLKFIRDERLNYWEAFRYDDQSGSVQPFTNVTADLNTFLDENYEDV